METEASDVCLGPCLFDFVWQAFTIFISFFFFYMWTHLSFHGAHLIQLVRSVKLICCRDDGSARRFMSGGVNVLAYGEE